MKKIKLLAVAVMLCAGSYFGYNAYNNATMTTEERLFLDNVEALTKHSHSPGCSYQGQLYSIGSIVMMEGERCVCTAKGWECEENDNQNQ